MLETSLIKKLLQHGLISAQDLSAVTKSRAEVWDYLVKNQIISARRIAEFVFTEFRYPYFDLDAFESDCEPGKASGALAGQSNLVNRLKFSNSHDYAVVLQKKANKAQLAVIDPTNTQLISEARFQLNCNLELVVVEADKLVALMQIVEARHKIDQLGDFGYDALANMAVPETEVTLLSEQAEDNVAAEDAPVVKFIYKVILQAISNKASDIHFEPYENRFRVRFRQDGILLEHTLVPVALAAKLASRLKIMANIDIAERRIPQDGRFKVLSGDKKAIDFRVSTCPTMFGEKIVLRILEPNKLSLGIEVLGFENFQRKIFLEAIKQPQGLVLVTGPTGSGKTLSLYTALNILNQQSVNISTVEDPVEIVLAGINQVQINTKAGLTFASAARAFLRQDPDIIMLGEIRDLETAEVAVQAAQTGHLVLSTLHTNSASETLMRLCNMGVEPFNLATSINLIMAQRLVRTLCPRCKAITKPPEQALLNFGFTEAEVNTELVLYQAVGCAYCQEGYKGRTGIYELLTIDSELRSIILQGSSGVEIMQYAKQHDIWLLRRSGIAKIKQGLTSIEEIARVTKHQ